MIAHSKILIVEDDVLIALEIAEAVSSAGGIVIGPVRTVAEALSVIDRHAIDAAILDGNLIDRDVTPVALKLNLSAVPMIIFSGIGLPADLIAQQPAIPLMMKPASADMVVGRLAQMIEGQPN